MSAIFVDTINSAWYAMVDESDTNHKRADEWFAANNQELVVTDFIIDELLTLLRIRSEFKRAREIGRNLLEGNLATVEWVTKADFFEAWQTFQQFWDKRWSFTDCVSRTVMSRLSITQALAFDQHFRQFSTITVIP